MHVGLVQVVAKPLHRIRIDIPILIVLRDTKVTNLKDSKFVCLQSSLYSGPIYFNSFPDFTVALNNLRIDKFFL